LQIALCVLLEHFQRIKDPLFAFSATKVLILLHMALTIAIHVKSVQLVNTAIQNNPVNAHFVLEVHFQIGPIRRHVNIVLKDHILIMKKALNVNFVLLVNMLMCKKVQIAQNVLRDIT